MTSEVWDEITHPSPTFKGCIIEVWEWICNFIPCNGNVITFRTTTIAMWQTPEFRGKVSPSNLNPLWNNANCGKTTPPLKSFRSGSLWKYINGSSQNMIDIKRLNDNHATWVYIIENNISGHIFHKSLFYKLMLRITNDQSNPRH